ncbi:MAG TPA: phosphatase PAP2 family protein [Candidatus Rubrimentiphilum sp.]|nr:phosphatase PAP2 family protein [Candidatus Rubrimentiphilum sp.]
MTRAQEYYAVAIVLFVLFVALGETVVRRPALRVDRAALFHSHFTYGAGVLTATGRSPFLVTASVIAAVIFVALRLPLWIPLVLILTQMLSQTLAELFKAHYRRVRPEYWVVGLDPGKSYPSGHAVTAIVFFGGWACVVAFTMLPPSVKYALVAILIAWAIAIDWSRLALGAHYLTDVAGGTLLGSAWVCAVIGALHQTALPVP